MVMGISFFRAFFALGPVAPCSAFISFLMAATVSFFTAGGRRFGFVTAPPFTPLV